MEPTQHSPVLATLTVGAGRKYVGLAVTGALAVALAWLALSPQPAPLKMRLLLLALAAAEAWIVWRLYRATQLRLELTEAGLSDSSGEVLAPMEQIEAVDRGLFAFKPSNGFLLRLKTPGPRRFRPGLYWQFGRRLGVGGLVHGAEAKQMADALALFLARRDGAED
ncbi:hypothetical protein [Pseudooceanicola sp. 200-1SW]|uniref:hypothetical protein n=1 Tax=Pseudooceanicola sp. 200-1SW TaxID=3425949 RepID=UPI003D7FCF4B